VIKAIIRWSAHNRVMVLAAAVVALVIAWWSMRTIPKDALPDLSDTQVIVFARWDRSPDIIEDQVTYPIITAMLGAPRVKTVRGFSDFGFSYVYVIFDDGTDPYWARTRVLEYLSKITPQLPAGAKVELGPDATSVGWVFQYALVDRSGRHATDELRSYQDWFLRYAIQAVPGVAEVATVGGQVRQYQVTVNPNALAAYNLPLTAVIAAVRTGNDDVGGRLVELSGREYMVRGRGYIKSIKDIESLPLTAAGGTPVQIKDVAKVALGPEMRRGVADLDGEGDVVGGIVVMRQGENALAVIGRVKAKLAELRPSLPAGVEVVTTYDRSVLIDEAIATVTAKLIEEMIIVSLIILVFLWHFPSSLVPIITIPISVALAFIPMKLMGMNANLMSLAGIAISTGVLVDGAIVEVENAYNKIYHWQAGGRRGDFHEVRLAALTEVGPGRVLLAVGDRGGVPADLHAGRSGGPAVQAAGVLEEPDDGDRRGAGDHARPGAADDVRADRSVPVPAALAGVAGDGDRRRALPQRGAPPDQPAVALAVRAAVPVRGAPPVADDRAGGGAGRVDGADLPAPRLGVHAAAARGHDPVHAVGGAAGHVGGRGAEGAAGAGQDLAVVPRGRAGVRQGRARDHADRPGAVHDDGDDDRAQAARSGAPSRAGTRRGRPTGSSRRCGRSGTIASARASSRPS
jgi:hypothetical protein